MSVAGFFDDVAHQEELRRLFKGGLSTRKIVRYFGGAISQSSVDRHIKLLGCKPLGACHCGKPAKYYGKCCYHVAVGNTASKRRSLRADEIASMCALLSEAVRMHPDELVGITTNIKVSRYGRNVTYYWQGSKDRSPERKRLLGRVPERVAIRASRMLLRQLAKLKRADQG